MAVKINFNLFKNRDFFGIPAIFFIICVFIGIAFISVIYFKMETESQKRIIRKEAEKLSFLVEGKIFAKLNDIVDSLRLSEDFINLLKINGDTSNREMQSMLNVLAASTNVDLIYVMDGKGKVFASAVSEGISLRGENFSFRPYFKNAVTESNYMYSALGVITGKRGIYCSRAININNRRIVIAVKMGMEEIEKIMDAVSGIAVLITPEGVIFASNDKELIFKTVDITGLKNRQWPDDVRRFEGLNLSGIKWVFKKEKFVADKEKFLYYALPAGYNGWMVMTAERESINKELWPVFMSIIAISCAGVMLILIFMFLSLRSVTKRKIAERHVVESERHLRRILNSTQEGFWQIDKNGYTIDINPAMCRILGYTKDELIGEPVSIFVKGVSVEIIKEYLLKSQQYDKTDPFKMEFVKKDGSKVPVIIKGTPLFSDTGEFIGAFAMISNMEDIFRIENALRQSEHNYREIFDSVNDAIFIHDLKDFHLVDVNKKMLEMYRCTKEQALSPGLYDKHFDSEERKIEYSRKAAEGIPQVFEWHASTWDNEPFWAEVSLKKAVIAGEDRVIAVVRNIEERKKAEDALKESEKKFRDMAENTADWIWEMDELGIIRYSNPQVYKLTGYSPEEIVGIDIRGKLAPEDKWNEFIELSKRSENKEVISMEGEIIHKNGTRVAADTKVIPFEIAGEKTLMFRGVSRDITDKKRAEQKIIMAMEELKRSNKDLEEFAYVASHDLKEPLRMVSSYVKLLEKKYADKLDNDAKDYIGYAADGAKRMQRLISDLLMYSRLGRTNIEFMDVDMDDLVKEVINSLELRIHEINADVIVETKLPVIYADRTQMVQLFQNLMANSLKFISDKKPEIRIGCEKKNGLYEFYVKDNGIGIDKAYFEKVFVIFQQLHTKDKYPGTGIGLSVCKKVVEQHGGTIRVESQEGKGTAFYFTISLELKEN
ncbi:MAG: hypothetical protein CVV21_06075 [Candidatus Goldiibacteriota bacterium HGW-Goldbacteria-1]|jgi:PAS domain S-box-containing protein|nr:MAG: hypothetical protein CVV21_06075 [Candidatus Goldiibacteriota bacterium HGW-Goldbacteria-1]